MGGEDGSPHQRPHSRKEAQGEPPFLCMQHHRRQELHNHVQMAALTASTNVGEGRRSDRSAALSRRMRPFNRDAVLEAKERCAGSTGARKKNTVEQVKGRKRIELYGNHCDAFSSKVASSRTA